MKLLLFIITYLKNSRFLSNCHINSMANQIWMFHISKITTKMRVNMYNIWTRLRHMTMTMEVILGSLRSSTRRLNDALSKQRNLSYKTKALNNLWSERYPPRLSHSQHNDKLSIFTSFEQRESLLRRYARSVRSSKL